MRLALLLTSGFESQDHRTLLRLAQAALGLGHQVSVFMMGDGVHCARRLAALSEAGALVVWCAHNARQRGLGETPGVLEGSQFEWAAMVDEADRVVCFG